MSKLRLKEIKKHIEIHIPEQIVKPEFEATENLKCSTKTLLIPMSSQTFRICSIAG